MLDHLYSTAVTIFIDRLPLCAPALRSALIAAASFSPPAREAECHYRDERGAREHRRPRRRASQAGDRHRREAVDIPRRSVLEGLHVAAAADLDQRDGEAAGVNAAGPASDGRLAADRRRLARANAKVPAKAASQITALGR